MGFAVTLADISPEAFAALRIIAEERADWEKEEREKVNNGQQ